MRCFAVALLILLFTSGCSDGNPASSGPEPTGDGVTTSVVETGPSGPILVTREDLGEDWPLTVEEGQLDCRVEVVGGYEKKYVTFTTTDGDVYAVNGAASQVAEDITPIWAAATDAPNKNIRPLIDRGLALCD